MELSEVETTSLGRLSPLPQPLGLAQALQVPRRGGDDQGRVQGSPVEEGGGGGMVPGAHSQGKSGGGSPEVVGGDHSLGTEHRWFPQLPWPYEEALGVPA